MNRPLENLGLALERLREALTIEANDIVRDGAIQRFEFCFELSWEAVQVYSRLAARCETMDQLSAHLAE